MPKNTLILLILISAFLITSCKKEDSAVISNLDQTAPSISTGDLALSGVTSASVDVTWTQATDNTDAATDLVYSVYHSTSATITTLEELKTNGTLFGTVTGAGVLSITGLTASTSYYINIKVADTAGNESLYTPATFNTSATTTTTTATATTTVADTTAPTSPTLSLNSGANSTKSATVTASLSASEGVGVTGYYLSESATTPISSAAGWTAVTAATSYVASVSFTLSAGEGNKTLSAWYKDAAGNVSAVASDSILLTSQWAQQFGTVANEHLKSAIFDGSGNLITIGMTAGDMVGTNGGFDDIIISKRNPAGTALWTQQIGGMGTDTVYQAALDSTGNIYIVGETDSATFDGHTRGLSHDCVILKYDSAGTKLWSKLINASDDYCRGVHIDGANNVFVVGISSGTIVNGITSHTTGTYSHFVSKIDPANGNPTWTVQSDYNFNEDGDFIIGDSAGNLYVAGRTEGSLGTPAHAGGGHDVYLVKYNSAGTQLWARMIGGTGIDQNPKLVMDGSGNVYVLGETSGAIAGETPLGGLDGFLAKFDSSGSMLWSKQFGTPSADTPGHLTLDSAGDIYISGSTQGTTWGTLAGTTDGFLLKYSPTGSQLWAKQYGETGDLSVLGLLMDSSKNVFVVGSGTTALFGTTNNGVKDMLILKNPGQYLP